MLTSEEDHEQFDTHTHNSSYYLFFLLAVGGLWALASSSAYAYAGGGAIECSYCTSVSAMANYAKSDANSRNLVGHLTYLVFNPGAGMVGKFTVSRYPNKGGGSGGGTCPKPRSPQNTAPNRYCRPLYRTSAIALTSTVGAMQRMWRDMVPAGFGPVQIPSNISSTCAGTSGQRSNVLNYLHQHFTNKVLPKGATGVIRFSDGSTSEYRVANAGAHQFTLVPGSNFDSAGNSLTDQCAAFSPKPAPQKTPGFSLPNRGRLSNMGIGGGGLGAEDVFEEFKGNPVTGHPGKSYIFERKMKSIWQFEHQP